MPSSARPWRGTRFVAVVEAYLALTVADLGLRLLPFRWLTRTLRGARAQAGADLSKVSEVSSAIAAGGRLALTPTCLRQAFAAAWMLRRRGIASQLHYGIAKRPAGGFHAHAWLLAGGVPVVGEQLADAFELVAVFPDTPDR
jgi:hypothetical protein